MLNQLVDNNLINVHGTFIVQLEFYFEAVTVNYHILNPMSPWWTLHAAHTSFLSSHIPSFSPAPTCVEGHFVSGLLAIGSLTSMQRK